MRHRIQGGGSAPQARQAYARLVEILSSAQRVLYQHHSEGLRNDLGLAAARRGGQRYANRHPQGRIDPRAGATDGANATPAKPAGPDRRVVARELDRQLDATRAALRAQLRAEYQQQNHGDGVDIHTAPAHGPPQANAERDRRRQDVQDTRAAAQSALEALKTLVARVRDKDYPNLGARPYPISIRAQRGDQLLRVGSGEPTAQTMLRHSFAALRGAYWRMRRITRHRVRHTDLEFEQARQRADTALALFQTAERKLRGDSTPETRLQHWKLRLATALATKLSDLNREELLPSPIYRPIAPAGPRLGVGATGSNIPGRPDHTLELRTDSTRGAILAAGINQPGQAGHPTDNTIYTHYNPATRATTIVITDGLSSLRSDLAADDGAETALTHIARTLTNPETGMLIDPDDILRAHRDGITRANAAVIAHDQPGLPNAPAALILTMTQTPVTTGGELITVAWVGDTRVYWLPANTRGRAARAVQLSTHHTRSGTEPGTTRLSGWLGADVAPVVPSMVQFHAGERGVLVVATQGVYLTFGERDLPDLAGSHARTAPARAAERIVKHARDRGAQDNLTVVVAPVNPAPSTRQQDPRGRRATTSRRGAPAGITRGGGGVASSVVGAPMLGQHGGGHGVVELLSHPVGVAVVGVALVAGLGWVARRWGGRWTRGPPGAAIRGWVSRFGAAVLMAGVLGLSAWGVSPAGPARPIADPVAGSRVLPADVSAPADATDSAGRAALLGRLRALVQRAQGLHQRIVDGPEALADQAYNLRERARRFADDDVSAQIITSADDIKWLLGNYDRYDEALSIRDRAQAMLSRAETDPSHPIYAADADYEEARLDRVEQDLLPRERALPRVRAKLDELTQQQKDRERLPAWEIVLVFGGSGVLMGLAARTLYGLRLGRDIRQTTKIGLGKLFNRLSTGAGRNTRDCQGAGGEDGFALGGLINDRDSANRSNSTPNTTHSTELKPNTPEGGLGGGSADCTSEVAPTVADLLRFSPAGPMQRLLARYLTPRDPAPAARFWARLGAPLMRRVIMGTIGRITRPGQGGNYRMHSRQAPLEALTRFALGGSAFNEAVHTFGAIWCGVSLFSETALSVLGTGNAGQFRGHLVLLALAGVLNVWLVAVQRYNRARAIRLVNALLARGRTFNPSYRNWAGLDLRAMLNLAGNQSHPAVGDGTLGGTGSEASLLFGSYSVPVLPDRQEDPFVSSSASDGQVGSSAQGSQSAADHVLSSSEINRILAWLEDVGGSLITPAELGLVLPRGPPGMKVLVARGEFPVAGVRAVGWASRRAVVISRAMAEQLAARYRVDPS
jgi:serine/threonine protein phosphatase PrpC